MSRRSFRVIQEMCGSKSNCTLFASSQVFGDPCLGVDKYLEVHYQCLPNTFKSTVKPRRPKPARPNVGSSMINVSKMYDRSSSTPMPSTSTSTTSLPSTSQSIQSTTTSTPSNSNSASRISTSTTIPPPPDLSSDWPNPAIGVGGGNGGQGSQGPSNIDIYPETEESSTENSNHPSSSFGEEYDSSMDEYQDTIPLPLSEQLRLMLTTGCVFAIICLFLTMLSLVMTGFPSSNPSAHVIVQSKRATLELQVKQNLTFCLLMVEILFVIGMNQSQGKYFCGFIASSLHFFFLAIFIWLFFDGFTLYLALLKQREDDIVVGSAAGGSSSIISCASKKRPCRCYIILAYGTPFVIHVLSTLLDSGSVSLSSSSSAVHCWLRSDKYFVLTFVGPVIAVLSANFLFLAITIVCSNYGSLFNLDKFSVDESNSNKRGLKSRLRTSLTVFVVMSLSLTALFVSLCQELPVDDLVFKSCLYVFCVLNPTQVLVILILFSSSSNSARQNSVKVLTSLGFLDSKASNTSSIARGDHHHHHLHHKDSSRNSVQEGVQEPIIPRPHSSSMNLAESVESPAPRGGGIYEGRVPSDHYGFRGNNLAASLNYRSPVYASSSGAASLLLRPTLTRTHHIHTKQCLQFPCQYPHVVEHVYESIDDDPYIARLLIPISTPLIGRKGQDGQTGGAAALPAIIRDNTNHSTIICGTTLTAAARASNMKVGGGQQVTVSSSSGQVSDQTSKGLRHESTLIWYIQELLRLLLLSWSIYEILLNCCLLWYVEMSRKRTKKKMKNKSKEKKLLMMMNRSCRAKEWAQPKQIYPDLKSRFLPLVVWLILYLRREKGERKTEAKIGWLDPGSSWGLLLL